VGRGEGNCVTSVRKRVRERRHEGGQEGMQTVGREVHVQDPAFTFLRYLCEWLTGAVLLAADMKKIVSAQLTHKHARPNVIVYTF
jgi:hypothetical protein